MSNSNTVIVMLFFKFDLLNVFLNYFETNSNLITNLVITISITKADKITVAIGRCQQGTVLMPDIVMTLWRSLGCCSLCKA